MKRLSRHIGTWLLGGCTFLGALWVCSLLEEHLQGLNSPVAQILQENSGYFALWRLAVGVLLFCVWPSFIRACAKRQGWSDAFTQARIEWRWPLSVFVVGMDLVCVEQVLNGIFF